MTVNRKINTEWIIAGAFLFLYSIFPNNIQGYDSYSLSISAKDTSDLFHPHHLIYNLFGYIIFSIFSFTGLGSMKILSLANTTFGILSILLVYKIIIKDSSRLQASLGAILTGSIFSFWYYSTSVEVNMAAIFFIMLAFYFLMTKSDNSNSGRLVYIFLCIGTLFHQIVALVGLAVLIYDMIRSKSIKLPLLRALPALLIGGVTYILVAYFSAEQQSISGIYKWITQYGHAGEWGKLSAANITQGVWGKLKGIYGGQVIREYMYGGIIRFAGVVNIIGMVIVYIGFAWIFIASCIRLYKTRDREQIFYLLTMIVLSAFTGWWAPHDDGFWLYPFVLFGLYIFSKPVLGKISMMVAIVIISMLFTMNLFFEFIPNSDKNNSHIYQASMAFKRLQLNGDDLVITNLSQARLAYEYYTEFHVPTTCMMFLPQGEKDQVIDDYHNRITEAHDIARVYMFEDELYPDPYRDYLFKRFNTDEYTQTYDRYLKHLVPADSVFIHGRYVKIFQLKM